MKMLMAKKFKLSLIFMLAALLMATSIPVSASGTVDKLKLTGDIGLDTRTTRDKGLVDELVFRASASTTHVDYTDISLYISYGSPKFVSDGKGGTKSKCQYEGDASTLLSKSEMNAKGKIELKLNAALDKNRAYCINTSTYVKRFNGAGIPATTIESDDLTTLWDPGKQFENWKQHDVIASINFEPGNKDFIRVRGIGYPNHADVSSYLLTGVLYEIKDDGSVSYVDLLTDSSGRSEHAEWASSKRFASDKKYKLLVYSTENYKLDGVQLTDFNTYELYWNPPGLQSISGLTFK